MSRAYQAREASAAGEVPALLGAAYVHIAIGVSILVVMLARLGAKLRRPVQVAPDSDHPWARLLGQANHWAFYIILIALPLGGLLAWYGRSDTAASLHAFLANALPWFIAAHVLGALTHQYVFRDHLINRIVRPGPGT
jgi:cytochrome b561